MSQDFNMAQFDMKKNFIHVTCQILSGFISVTVSVKLEKGRFVQEFQQMAQDLVMELFDMQKNFIHVTCQFFLDLCLELF